MWFAAENNVFLTSKLLNSPEFQQTSDTKSIVAHQPRDFHLSRLRLCREKRVDINSLVGSQMTVYETPIDLKEIEPVEVTVVECYNFELIL